MTLLSRHILPSVHGRRLPSSDSLPAHLRDVRAPSASKLPRAPRLSPDVASAAAGARHPGEPDPAAIRPRPGDPPPLLSFPLRDEQKGTKMLVRMKEARSKESLEKPIGPSLLLGTEIGYSSNSRKQQLGSYDKIVTNWSSTNHAEPCLYHNSRLLAFYSESSSLKG